MCTRVDDDEKETSDRFRTEERGELGKWMTGSKNRNVASRRLECCWLRVLRVLRVLEFSSPYTCCFRATGFNNEDEQGNDECATELDRQTDEPSHDILVTWRVAARKRQIKFPKTYTWTRSGTCWNDHFALDGGGSRWVFLAVAPKRVAYVMKSRYTIPVRQLPKTKPHATLSFIQNTRCELKQQNFLSNGVQFSASWKFVLAPWAMIMIVV